MNGDLKDDKGKYVEFKEFVRPSAVHDMIYIFVNFHDDHKYLSNLDTIQVNDKMKYIIFICKEHYNDESNKIKDINRKCRPFWFPLIKSKYRCIPILILIELCRLKNEYKGMKLRVIASRKILFVGASYINQIFDSAIEIDVPTPTPEPVISDQSIKIIKRILKEHFNECNLFDLDNIPKIKHNELNQNTFNIFVRNLKTKNPNIGEFDNIIVVPTEKDSADVVIIIIMAFITKFLKKCKCINVISNDFIFKLAKFYISFDKTSNYNINIIDSTSNQF